MSFHTIHVVIAEGCGGARLHHIIVFVKENACMARHEFVMAIPPQWALVVGARMLVRHAVW